MIRMQSPCGALCVLPAMLCLAQGADLDNRGGAKSVPDFAAATTRRAEYRAELDRFRNEFGGTRVLPPQPFFLFGMGLRPKFSVGWACDHFHGQRRSPISDRDYPLTWEVAASQARYQGMALVSEEYVKRKLAAPHTWHGAEVFLYLFEAKRN